MLGRLGEIFRAMAGGLSATLRHSPAVRAIALSCVAVYAVQGIAWHIPLAAMGPPLPRIPLGAALDRTFGLFWPVASRGAVWQPVTFAFLHGSLWHLLLNLFALVFFGYAVERIVGSPRFWFVFLASSAVGGIGWMLFDSVEPYVWYAVKDWGAWGLRLAQRWGEAQAPGHGSNVCVGASAGVFGLLGAFTALCPRERLTLLLFYVVPVRLQARHVALLLVALNVFELVTSFGRVAYVAHLLGGLVGYLYARRLAAGGRA